MERVLSSRALAASHFFISSNNITFRFLITWLTSHFPSYQWRHWDSVPLSYVPLCQSFGMWPFPICLGPGEASDSMGLELTRSLVQAFHGEALLAWSPRRARLGLELVGDVTTLLFDPTSKFRRIACNSSLFSCCIIC